MVSNNNTRLKKTLSDSNTTEHGNVQALRDMWSLKVKEQANPIRPLSNRSRLRSEQQQQQTTSKTIIPTLKITNEIVTNATTKNDIIKKTITFEPVEELPSIEEDISLSMPPPPPSILFKHQAESVALLQQSVNKMMNNEKKDIKFPNRTNNGIHLWHITRHVFRSGLVCNRPRRASDTIIPLLIKTEEAKCRARSNSIDSTLSDTPFESLIDYINYDKHRLVPPKITTYSTSDTADCMRRNKLNDTIFQYERILNHLKNYDQFKSTYPIPIASSSSIATKERGKSIGSDIANDLDQIKAKFLAKSSIPNRHTNTFPRNVSSTFAQFIMNDLFLSTSSRRSSNEHRCLYMSHASSQTDLSEPIHDNKEQSVIIHPRQTDRSFSAPNEETKAVIEEFDAMLQNSDQSSSITPNCEINVIVLNQTLSQQESIPTEKPLMQRLFEGKKTAYSPDDLNMQLIRLPEEMMVTYETAKKKCFFDTEQLIYTARMIKISRRGYSQHLRMLCITTQRLYNITKKDPYPKEGLLFKDIIGVTCTPYKDGFVCIHTRDSHEDRGDWLILVDHPCEFITQLFMAMGRDNNDDNFLKIETQFTHCRRFFGEASSSDCQIEARISDSFRIKKADFDAIIIYTP